MENCYVGPHPHAANPGNDNKRNWWDSRIPVTNRNSRHESSFSKCGSYCLRGWDRPPPRAASNERPLDANPVFCDDCTLRVSDSTIVVFVRSSGVVFDPGGKFREIRVWDWKVPGSDR